MNLQTLTCKTHVFSDSGIMITPQPGTAEVSNFRLPKQRQLQCIGLTVTYEKITFPCKKNTIKILAKLKSATSHSIIDAMLTWFLILTIIFANNNSNPHDCLADHKAA